MPGRSKMLSVPYFMQPAFNKRSWWPDVSDLQKAELAARYGFWAAVVVASLSTIFAAMALYNHKPIVGIDAFDGLFDAFFFAAIAYGVYRKSRAAAVAGFGMYAVYFTYLLAKGPADQILTAGVLTLCFVHSVRGTVAYRKLSQALRAWQT